MDPVSKDSPTASAATNVDRVKMVVYAKNTGQPPVLAALVRQLEAQKGRLDFEILQDASRVFGAIEQTTMTVLILTLHQKEELVEILNVLTLVQSRIQSGLLRGLVINGINHPRVLALLRVKGVQETVDFDTNIKALTHKIKNAFLLVTQTFQRLQNQNIRASTVVGGDISRARVTSRNESTSEVQWEKSPEHAGDFWWIPSAKNLRNVMGRWLIDILGPGPAAGFWVETTYERNDEKGWVWKPRVPNDAAFLPKSGRWIFFGRQPEFVWQKNLWAFVSKMPYLAFYADGQSESEFVRIDSGSAGSLKVFENSEISRTYLPKIQASLEASLKLSKPSEITNEIRGNFDPSSANASIGSMDFMPSAKPPTNSGNAGSRSSADATPPSADWNDHTGAVGFEFKSEDLRVDESGKKAKWRSALKSDVAAGSKLGLEDIRQVGVTSGAKSFEKLVLDIRPVARNGVDIAKKAILRVIEMTTERASFEFPRANLDPSDKFLFTVEFRLADVEKKFELDWIVESVQPIEGAGCLVQGSFTGGARDDLAQILKLIAQRQLELKDFFLVAKGA